VADTHANEETSMILPLVLAASAIASDLDGERLVVQVVDDAQDAVPTATVRIDDEGLRHRVNHRTGKWRGNAIYPDNEAPRGFEPGQVLTITAAAPGHLPRTVKYRVHPRRNVVQIPLQPLGRPPAGPDAGPSIDAATLLAVSRADCDSPDQGGAFGSSALSLGAATGSKEPLQLNPDTIARLGDLKTADPQLTTDFSELLLAQGTGQIDAALEWAHIGQAEAHTTEGEDYVGLVDDLYRVRAMAYHVRWQQWELTWLDEPNRKNRDQLEQYRKLSADVASDWVQWAHAAGRSTELPTALCMAASDRPLECTP
jgi:hypothetical protein